MIRGENLKPINYERRKANQWRRVAEDLTRLAHAHVEPQEVRNIAIWSFLMDASEKAARRANAVINAERKVG